MGLSTGSSVGHKKKGEMSVVRIKGRLRVVNNQLDRIEEEQLKDLEERKVEFIR